MEARPLEDGLAEKIDEGDIGAQVRSALPCQLIVPQVVQLHATLRALWRAVLGLAM